MLQLVNSTIQDVAKKEGLSWDVVERIFNRHLRAEVDWDEFDSIPVIGVDEIAILKGHRRYFLIVTARREKNHTGLGRQFAWS